MKWRIKILLMCLACTLSALVLQTVLFQNTSSQILKQQMEADSVGALQNLQNSMYSYLNTMESNLIKIYEEKEIINALNTGVDVQTMRKNYANLARDFTTSAFETSDGVRALYLYEADHRIISNYRRYVTPKHNYPTDLYSDAQYNGQVIREYMDSDKTGLLISSYYNTHREKNIIHLVMKIFAGYQYDRAVGYVVCDVDSDKITSLMKKSVADPAQFVWLQPAGDRVAVSIGELNEGQYEDYQKLSERNASRNSRKQPENPKYSVFFQAKQSRYDLTAYTLVSRELLRQNQRGLTADLMTIALLMILVTAVMTSLVVRSMTKPLSDLTGTMDRIKDGMTHLRVRVKRNDELGMLGKNFNEMLDRMEELRIKEQEHIRLLDQAEYRALQAQINPHFLYNTLETMAAIAEMEDCQEVSELSYSLSKVFRYALNTRDNFSTVEKEIQHLKNYTYIMDVRMHGDVEYCYDIDPQLLGELIPKLSLQPLVENALNHGLKNKVGAKRVSIIGRMEQNTVMLIVEDNGVGMDADAMNSSLRTGVQQSASGEDSIGLHNIHGRLKLLQGQQYGLHIESEKGHGTRVTMTLPRMRGESV